ncbi:MAG: YceI family protein [Breznakibacter sp.]
MKKMSLLVVALMVAVSGFAQSVKFDASKSELKWTGKKVSGEHWGYVSLKSGELDVKNNKVVSGKFVIDMTTINVKDLEPGEWNDKLLGHLKSDDFFSVDKYKTAELVVQGGAFVNNEATLNGQLTIKGVTHPIAFKAVKTATGYTATIGVDRTKYGIKYGSGKFFDSLGDKMIYDEFTLDVKLTL